MPIGKMAKIAAFILLTYLLAWLLAYFALVGFSLRGVGRYFIQTWTFTGPDSPSLVWLLSWPIFSILLLALHMLRVRQIR
ncbi:MAG TPA: hypothetical protein VHB46_05645 [Burkholderiales bacterium]|nr:hypothetical protein [Burkholderiales bacterium]